MKVQNLPLETVETLRILQLNHEKDPKNINAAYRYLKELNRVGMHQTVIRLYHKYDYEDSDRRIQLEYEYAVDHIDQIKGMIMAAQMYPQMEDKGQNQSMPRYLFKKSFQLLMR